MCEWTLQQVGIFDDAISGEALNCWSREDIRRHRGQMTLASNQKTTTVVTVVKFKLLFSGQQRWLNVKSLHLETST